MYLFRITTKPSSVWGRTKPRPLYIVAKDRHEATEWASSRLQSDLAISKVSCLAEQVAGMAFVGLK